MTLFDSDQSSPRIELTRRAKWQKDSYFRVEARMQFKTAYDRAQNL